MRSLLDTEEEEESKASEITLSTASLLGIFFGLVLVCGVFFGFGYSMGRGSGLRPLAAAIPAAANLQPESSETMAAENQAPPESIPAPALPAPRRGEDAGKDAGGCDNTRPG